MVLFSLQVALKDMSNKYLIHCFAIKNRVIYLFDHSLIIINIIIITVVIVIVVAAAAVIVTLKLFKKETKNTDTMI